MKKCRRCKNEGLCRQQRHGMVFYDYCDCRIGQDLEEQMEMDDGDEFEEWEDYYGEQDE